MLQDGIFVRGDWIKSKANQALSVKLLTASLKGWAYCRDHFKECVNIVVANGTALPKGHQTWQMNEVNALGWPKSPRRRRDGSRFLREHGGHRLQVRRDQQAGIQGGISLGSGQEGSRRPEEAGHRRLRKEVEEVGRQADGRREVRRDGREIRMSVLIKGGRIITAADDYVGDIYVEGERISLIGESLDLQAERVIDAAGKYVLPGLRRPSYAPRHAVRRDDDDR